MPQNGSALECRKGVKRGYEKLGVLNLAAEADPLKYRSVLVIHCVWDFPQIPNNMWPHMFQEARYNPPEPNTRQCEVLKYHFRYRLVGASASQ